jgi:hypothetical protein
LEFNQGTDLLGTINEDRGIKLRAQMIKFAEGDVIALLSASRRPALVRTTGASSTTMASRT